ncbi:WD40/YVTN/BNR-like repeat-containing protein [Parapedobacter indicus]|uniref:Photosynthesis system II assembly factor Ycf48/Hcf136-like domain-containing protein n=1 Tax=Parapedobacter indicus TaxID=1477437 RepID=A0A1I3D7B6_9SPHI|nr:YCF48-related protein [Parapedobacter indicus]PPL04555.1 photosystem II stability/assembly factor-like uncharacterized protein [Parapedobacter indicus]SFH82613.1 Uncharacterized protein SAMN05444682_101345 [Parapedobacter indicus]
MTAKGLLTFLVVILLVGRVQAQHPRLRVLQGGKSTSIRGLSVPDDSVAWVSGSNGWVGRTTDGGKTWDWQQVVGHETKDFRDIEAFSRDTALLMNAGSPLVILRTTDGGRSWHLAHRDERPAIFVDGMDFWDDRRGLAYGDPIDGLLQLLATEDGGRTWHDISQQAGIRLAEGEAGFAASGTGIRTLPGGYAFIATGGLQSRLLHTTDYGHTWIAEDCPIIQGKASMGIFSIAFQDERHGIAVGGDYQQDRHAEDVVFVTTDSGASWRRPIKATGGYRSAVEYVGDRQLVAAGTSGVDYSSDGGMTWEAISRDGYHVVRRAKKGHWILLAGADGRIATLQP